MSGSIDRRIARLERGAVSGAQDLAAMLDAGRSEIVTALRTGADADLADGHRQRRIGWMSSLEIARAARRLTPLEGRLLDALQQSAEAACPSA